jgi:hypothetical protein
MSFISRVIQIGAQVVLERPVQTLSLDAQRTALHASGERLALDLGMVRDTPAHRRLLRHIIGIERWGQRRLRSVLGSPLLHDEYLSYSPAPNRSWEELKSDFREVRQTTLDLIEELRQAGPAVMCCPIPHNQFGMLTPKAWLRYLDLHANGEMLKMK